MIVVCSNCDTIQGCLNESEAKPCGDCCTKHYCEDRKKFNQGKVVEKVTKYICCFCQNKADIPEDDWGLQ